MGTPYAYLADGKLYARFDAAAEGAELLDSPFVRDLIDRAERARERGSWKQQGMAWQVTAAQGRFGFPANGPDPSARRVRFTGVARGEAAGDLIYAVETDAAGGLFRRDPADGSERRLLHRAKFAARDLCRNPADGAVAMSLVSEDGSANLGLMEAGGRGVRTITEGDSLDQAPAWVGGATRTIVYQSAGIGRNAAGFPTGQGPYAVLQLDLISGDMHTLAEDDAFDFLLPRKSGDGSLYFLRRPYHPLGRPPVSPVRFVQDVVLFPFRLVRAIVHFLDWFSMVFSRKPLLTAGGPKTEGPDARYVMLWGKLIDAERAMKAKETAGTGLVPKSWELVRRAPDGTETVLAGGVVSYDLCSDGGLVYTTGTVVHRRAPDGSTQQLGTGHLIEHVVAL